MYFALKKAENPLVFSPFVDFCIFYMFFANYTCFLLLLCYYIMYKGKFLNITLILLKGE